MGCCSKTAAVSSYAQRAAIEKILSGQAGGPWAVLSRFVGRWLDVRYLPIEIRDAETTKQVSVSGLLEGAIADRGFGWSGTRRLGLGLSAESVYFAFLS